MKNFIKNIICLTTFLLLSQVFFAQGRTVIEIDGKKYYQHIVEAGNTLYAISKLYQVDEEAIILHNPGVENGLILNQELLIPLESEKVEDKWTNPIRIEGRFLIHRVKRKETLYQISKEYKVTINDILETNPKANSGLSKGMELKIPINDVDDVTLDGVLTEIEVIDTSQYLTHKVKQGETLYFLSKYYDESIEDIKKLNGGMEEGLKLGSTILIRYKTDADLTDIELLEEGELVVHRTDNGEKTLDRIEFPIDMDVIKESYGIALMLPFYFEESAAGSLPRKESKLQEIAFHFYEGVMIAVDSLKEYGLNAEIYLFDVNGNDESLEEIFDRPEMKSVHLVIGPFQKNQATEAARLCLERGIHMVCPVAQTNKLLIDQPNVSKAHPSTYTQMEMLAVDVVQLHHNDNVILVNTLDTRDALMVKAFRNSYENEILKYPEARASTLLEVKSSKSVGNILEHLKPGMENIVVVPSKDKVAVQNIFTQLTRSNYSLYPTTLYGIEEWWDFKFIDFDSKKRFHLTIATPIYVDYSNDNVMSFVDNFKSKKSVEPSKYAFKGYDIMTYYGKGLVQFGLAFPQYFDQIDQKGLLLTKFKYFQPDVNTGFENKHIFVLETQDDRIEERSVGFVKIEEN